MSACPPVTHLVLYKHGVAFVVHRGPADGAVTLTVRRDDMPDVLKSLVVSGADAAVGAITFDTPVDPPHDPDGYPLAPYSTTALRDLLDGLRGRSVEVQQAEATYRGEVIGVDEPGAGERALLLRTGAGRVQIVELAAVGRLTVLDTGAREELVRLLDRAKAATAGPHCAIGVDLRGRAAEVELSYLVAAPMWRVSYRLIRDGERATLAAMGILHNPVDEDLTDITVTLTTGQPHSFDIDLYHPRQVRRTVAEERQRVVEEQMMRGAPRAAATVLSGVPDFADSYGEAAEEVDAADSGEYFEYRLTTPVTLARGSATMVPLAVAPVGQVRRELVWQVGSAPAPQIAIAFVNDTDLVLEEGPAVIYEHGGYAGEAMLGFTARGARTRLSFAKDLAVHCTGTVATATVTVGVRLADTAAIEEQRVEQRHALRLRNDHPDEVEVIVELPRRAGHHITGDDTAALLDDGDPDFHRFAVTVAGHRTVGATVLETWPVYRDIGYGELSPAHLDAWLAGRALDAATIGELSGVLAEQQRADALDAQRDRLDAERTDLHAAASRITEQLQVLRTDGDEGRLRARQVGALGELQDQVAVLDAEIRRLGAEAAAAREAAAAQLQRLLS
ncbi:hypothetical protein ABQE69_10635 [Mycolicibacillus trivialis]|uniref:DUF4139 domain-containing protein n=1 Tax=Mycolicibacillus trivialis TaxID=1798 RepID=A0A1X2EGH4_9MYCO|nr:hypothetical protein [Mycolicibacillus trivialis]ORX01288.1 hypothetical protein AWC30_13805 [Mycolicibacillus trivialis]